MFSHLHPTTTWYLWIFLWLVAKWLKNSYFLIAVLLIACSATCLQSASIFSIQYFCSYTCCPLKRKAGGLNCLQTRREREEGVIAYKGELACSFVSTWHLPLSFFLFANTAVCMQGEAANSFFLEVKTNAAVKLLPYNSHIANSVLLLVYNSFPPFLGTSLI